MIVAYLRTMMFKTLPSLLRRTHAPRAACAWATLLVALCLLTSGCVVNPVPTPGGGGFAAADRAAELDAVGSKQATDEANAGATGGAQDDSGQDAASPTDTDTIASPDGQQTDGGTPRHDADNGG